MLLLIASAIASLLVGIFLGHTLTVLYSREEEYISLTPKGLQALKEYKEYKEKRLSPRDDA